MDIVRFIRWWWSRRIRDEKIVFIIITSMITIITLFIVFGAKALVILLLTALLVFFSWALYAIARAIRGQWNKFQFERECEAQEIVEKLAGVPPVSRATNSDVENILSKIKARRKIKTVV